MGPWEKGKNLEKDKWELDRYFKKTPVTISLEMLRSMYIFVKKKNDLQYRKQFSKLFRLNFGLHFFFINESTLNDVQEENIFF